MFDQAKLAVVAYAEVNGMTGSSTKTNSGVTTTRLGLGTYAIDLPVASANQLGLQQFSDRDLIFVQPLTTITSGGGVAFNNLSATAINDADPTRKLVITGSLTTAIDCDFSILILRTLTPPVLGGSA